MNPEHRAIRVHLVDDHDMMRAGLKRLLEDEPDIRVVVESDCGECTVDDYMEHQPDIVIMDLAMPGKGGFDACRRILAKDAKARVLVLSFHTHELVASYALKAGAMGYISKGSSAARLIHAVREILAGKTFMEPAIAQKLAAGYAGSKGSLLQDLSPREFEILLFIAEGLSTVDIASRLSLSPKTVGNHHYHILKKMHVTTKAELIRFTIQAGIISS